jgi:hypothetical protein
VAEKKKKEADGGPVSDVKAEDKAAAKAGKKAAKADKTAEKADKAAAKGNKAEKADKPAEKAPAAPEPVSEPKPQTKSLKVPKLVKKNKSRLPRRQKKALKKAALAKQAKEAAG